MSLISEKIQIEARIAKLKYDQDIAIVTGDLSITNIRQEASVLLDLEDIDMDKIDVAVAQLRTAIGCIANTNKEIKRLEKMLY